jgi:hypothetical protein
MEQIRQLDLHFCFAQMEFFKRQSMSKCAQMRGYHFEIAFLSHPDDEPEARQSASKQRLDSKSVV